MPFFCFFHFFQQNDKNSAFLEGKWKNRQLARNWRLFHFFTFPTVAVYSICSFELNVKIVLLFLYFKMCKYGKDK